MTFSNEASPHFLSNPFLNFFTFPVMKNIAKLLALGIFVFGLAACEKKVDAPAAPAAETMAAPAASEAMAAPAASDAMAAPASAASN